MSDTVISIENLSKRYLVGHRTVERSPTLRDLITREVRNFGRKAADIVHGRQIVQGDEIEEFWALRNVTFDVKRGEVFGIIGRNGAGKSTLLKILSRITDPTEGRIAIRGRVASLLEVGTGFHNELTGRENIFLNGAILGMTQQEIRKKFDEIVAFAEVERFLDTPVKRYSSGMYVRLAFSVAAHLDPEILIVDEVLAVGDADFQKKCLGKMGDISRREDRTVLFVSHNITAVGELTSRAALLNSGTVEAIGSTAEVIGNYVAKARNEKTYVRPEGRPLRSPHVARAEVVTTEANGTQRFRNPLQIKLWIKHDTPMKRACLSFQIINQFQQPAVHVAALYPDITFGHRPGETLLTCHFPILQLNVGQYYLRIHLTEPPGGEIYERLDNICRFEVLEPETPRLWGWHATDCTYHEEYKWDVSDS